jgi:hypothetical protein
LQKADEAAAERAGFRFFADPLGELMPFCGDCAERAGSEAQQA